MMGLLLARADRTWCTFVSHTNVKKRTWSKWLMRLIMLKPINLSINQASSWWGILPQNLWRHLETDEYDKLRVWSSEVEKRLSDCEKDFTLMEEEIIMRKTVHIDNDKVIQIKYIGDKGWGDLQERIENGPLTVRTYMVYWNVESDMDAIMNYIIDPVPANRAGIGVWVAIRWLDLHRHRRLFIVFCQKDWRTRFRQVLWTRIMLCSAARGLSSKVPQWLFIKICALKIYVIHWSLDSQWQRYWLSRWAGPNGTLRCSWEAQLATIQNTVPHQLLFRQMHICENPQIRLEQNQKMERGLKTYFLTFKKRFGWFWSRWGLEWSFFCRAPSLEKWKGKIHFGRKLTLPIGGSSAQTAQSQGAQNGFCWYCVILGAEWAEPSRKRRAPGQAAPFAEPSRDQFWPNSVHNALGASFGEDFWAKIVKRKFTFVVLKIITRWLDGWQWLSRPLRLQLQCFSAMALRGWCRMARYVNSVEHTPWLRVAQVEWRSCCMMQHALSWCTTGYWKAFFPCPNWVLGQSTCMQMLW